MNIKTGKEYPMRELLLLEGLDQKKRAMLPGGPVRKIWSGIRESNPCYKLGKLVYSHYTNPARVENAGDCSKSEPLFERPPDARRAWVCLFFEGRPNRIPPP